MFRKHLLAAAIVLVVLGAVFVAWQAGWFAAAPPAEPDATLPAAAAAVENQDCDEKRAHRFPVAVDTAIPFEDNRDGGVDGCTPYRSFTLTDGTGAERQLAAIHLDEPAWQRDRSDDQSLVTRLADLNAAFHAAVSLALPVAGEWSEVRVVVGDFAQDYCGDLTVVVTLRKVTTFAVAFGGADAIDLAASRCPLRPADYLAERAKFGQRDEPDDYSAFCAVRRECLQAYYGKPENQGALRPRWLEEVANVRLR